MKVSVKTDVGLVRQTNQDYYLYRKFCRGTVHLCAVADGIGGYRAGEVASRLSLDVVAAEARQAVETGASLRASLEDAMAVANREVVRQSLSNPEYTGMGTTVTAALFRGRDLVLGHIGDSRAYLVRGGRLKQLTRDHSLVAELVRNGDLTEAEAQSHPQRNILTQAFGSDLRAKADVSQHTLENGDILLLCTDGLTGLVGVADIEATLAAADSLDHACERLVAMANDRGGSDNITVLLAGPMSFGGGAE